MTIQYDSLSMILFTTWSSISALHPQWQFSPRPGSCLRCSLGQQSRTLSRARKQRTRYLASSLNNLKCINWVTFLQSDSLQLSLSSFSACPTSLSFFPMLSGLWHRKWLRFNTLNIGIWGVWFLIVCNRNLASCSLENTKYPISSPLTWNEILILKTMFLLPPGLLVRSLSSSWHS